MKSASLFTINLIFRLIIEKMESQKVGIVIPESEAGKRQGDGTGSVALPSVAVGGQEVEKKGQEAPEKVEMEDCKEETVVEKVKSKGTDKLEIRKPIVRFGPLRGTNLVTINKRKGKNSENYTLSTPVYTVYFQRTSKNNKKDFEKEKGKVLYSTAGKSTLEKGGAKPHPTLTTTQGVSLWVADSAGLGVSLKPAKPDAGPSSLVANQPPKVGESLESMKTLSKSLDGIEDSVKTSYRGGFDTDSSDADIESEGAAVLPRGAPKAGVRESSDTDGRPRTKWNSKQRRSKARAADHQSDGELAAGGRGGGAPPRAPQPTNQRQKGPDTTQT